MSTTTLIVEMLIAGAIADIWLFMAIERLYLHKIDITLISPIVNDMSTILIFPFIALTYGLGIAINFAAEKITLWYWNIYYRDKYFQDKGIKNHSKLSGIVYHKGRAEVIDGLRNGVHIIRVARSSSLNFLILSIVILFYWNDTGLSVIIGALFFLFISLLTYFEGPSRFMTNHKRTYEEYEAIMVSKDAKPRTKNVKARKR